MGPVRLALIGCGWVSGSHVNGYRELLSRGCRDFLVTACCDLAEENAAVRAMEIAEVQGSTPAVFTDTAALVGAGVADAADICLPHCFHHGVATQLLRAGMHVMVEKPLGITIRASSAIIRAGEESGRIVATAENVRRCLSSRACAWAVRTRGLLGEMVMANVQSLAHKPLDYERGPFKWRGLKFLTGGGMLMDGGAHLADMVQVLFGEVDEVLCSLWTLDHRMIRGAPIVGDAPADVEDTWHAVIRFRNGVRVLWTYSRAVRGEGVAIGDYYGRKGSLRDLGFPLHPFQGGATAFLSDGSTVSGEEIQAQYLASLPQKERDRLFPYGVTDGFAVEIWDFVDAIRAGRRPEMDGSDGLRAKALCECCYESATLGRPVKFDDVLSGRVCAYQKPIDAFWDIPGEDLS
jgi:UDP-N-acetyl-2-amino-2-deoxyglucuronate dehydrogenase